jgi:hypothetical protein
VHLVVVTVVDAASRRHNLGFESSQKYTVFDSSVNVPGMGPVILFPFKNLE